MVKLFTYFGKTKLFGLNREMPLFYFGFITKKCLYRTVLYITYEIRYIEM